MRRVNLKITLTIMLYSLFMTACLLTGLFLFVNLSKPQDLPNEHEVLFYADNGSLLNGVTGGEIKVDINSSVNMTQLDAFYKEQFTRYIPVGVIIICVFVFITSMALWFILKVIYKGQLTGISSQLKRIELDMPFDIAGQPLECEFQGIIDKLNRYFNDYKRLNSYITHEQKNGLALLRAKLEIRGDTELVKSIDSISSSIDDILTISQSKENVNLSPVDLALVCAEACDEYKKVYPSITFCFDEDDDNTILAKEIWLYRGVCNLIDNAIKYGNGGEIAVTVSQKQDSVIITVSDNGIGIEPDLIEQIFNDNFRISQLKKNGYGIGLSLVRHVCDLCGGLCYVDSKVGVGSTFYLVFPYSS